MKALPFKLSISLIFALIWTPTLAQFGMISEVKAPDQAIQHNADLTPKPEYKGIRGDLTHGVVVRRVDSKIIELGVGTKLQIAIINGQGLKYAESVPEKSIAIDSVVGGKSGTETDLTIVSTIKVGKDKTGLIQTLYLTEGKIRITQEREDCIVDAATGQVIMIDHIRKEYSEAFLSEVEASLSEMLARTETQMPTNSMARKMMTRMFSNLSVTEGKMRRNFAGYDCNQYIVRIGEGEFECWATPKLQPPASYYEVMEKFFASISPIVNPYSAIYREMQKRKMMPLAMTLTTMHVGLLEGLNAGLSTLEPVFGMPGAPIKIKGKAKTDTLSEATEVKIEPIPASTFDVPTGYVKKDSPYKAR